MGQTTIQNAGSIMLGSAKISIGASAGSATTDIGLARNVNLTENLTKYTSQSDNGPDPINGVSRHTVNVSFELLELWPPNWITMYGSNFVTSTTGSGTYVAGTANVMSTGGGNELTNIAIKLTNNTLQSGATVQTIVVVYSATIEDGLNLAFQSDNSDDPVMATPFTFVGELDTSRSVKDQLFIVESELGA